MQMNHTHLVACDDTFLSLLSARTFCPPIRTYLKVCSPSKKEMNTWGGKVRWTNCIERIAYTYKIKYCSIEKASLDKMCPPRTFPMRNFSLGAKPENIRFELLLRLSENCQNMGCPKCTFLGHLEIWLFYYIVGACIVKFSRSWFSAV